MLLFEIKKIFKSRIVYIIMAFSVVISFYSSVILSSDRINKSLEENIMTGSEALIVHDVFSDLYSLYQKETLMEKDPYDIKKELQKAEKGTEEYKELLNIYTKIRYEYFKLKYDFIQKYKDIYPELLEINSQEKINNIEWQMFKYGKLLENNASDYYSTAEYFGDNSIQQIVNSSNILFGIFPVLFFIFLFSNFFSKEREDETLNLLYTQPSKKNKIIISKYFAILLSSIIYIIFTFIFFNLFSLIKGVPIGGLRDIYRVIDSTNHLAYIEGYSLVLQIVLYYLILINFWSFLAMILSIRYKSTKSLGISLSIFSILYLAMNLHSEFRNVYNPVYALNIKDLILGKFELVTKNGISNYIQIDASKITNLTIHIIIIAILVLISFRLKDERKVESKYSKVNKINSLFEFETLKILKEKTLLIYLFTFCMIIGIQAISSNFLYKNLRDNFVNTEILDLNDKKTLDEYNTMLDNYNDEKWLLEHYFDDPNGKKIDDIPEKDLEKIEAQKQMYEFYIQNVDKNMADRKYKIENFKQNNSKEFYSILKNEFQNNWEVFSYSDKIMGGRLSNKSLKFNTDLFEQSSKYETDVFPIISSFLSIDENYKTSQARNLEYRNSVIPSTSAFTLPYNLLKTHYLDLVLALVISMSVFVGYTIDKGGKNNLEFIFTTPISKRKYNMNKNFTQLVLGLVLLLILILYITVLGFISEGFSGYNFPVAIYDEMGYSFIYLSSYLLKVVFGIIAVLIFLVSLMNLISIFVKHRNILYLLSIIFVVGGYTISGLIPESIGKLLPFIYLRISTLADQSLYLLSDISFVSYQFGLIILIIWAIINLILSNFIIKFKKN